MFSPTYIAPSMYIENRNIHTIFVSPVERVEVETINRCIKISYAGWDLITPRIVKRKEHIMLSYYP